MAVIFRSPSRSREVIPNLRNVSDQLKSSSAENNVVSLEQARHKYRRLEELRSTRSRLAQTQEQPPESTLERLPQRSAQHSPIRPSAKSPTNRPIIKKSKETRLRREESRKETATSNVVEVQPQSQPKWLRALTIMQYISSGVAGILVGATLVAYGTTVYMESQWTKEYQTLEQLRTQEQQLRAAGEVLKHKIAQEADQDGTGLVQQQPINMIFLRPAPLRPEVSSSSTPTLESKVDLSPIPEKPLGY
ncbi:MAG: hypothetical protein ACFBSC_02295 [Microcoleaceae cyanobacterium]